MKAQVKLIKAKDLHVNSGQVKGLPKNPRSIRDARFEALKKSISDAPEMLELRPVVAYDNDGELVVIMGNMRTRACKDLGIAEIPTIILPKCTPIKKLREYSVKDNISFGDNDWDAFANEWELAELSEWGLETWEMADLLSGDDDTDVDQSGCSTDIEATEDDFDEDADHIEVRCKRGDIWQLGNHRLMCGDSISLEDVKKLTGGGQIDMIFTDPPYGYSYQSTKRAKDERFDVIKNDDNILDFFPNVKRICNGFVFVCTTWKVLNKWIPLFEQYMKLTNMVIWDKGGGGIGDLEHTFSTDYEVILVSNQNRSLCGKRIGSVWDVTKDAPSLYVHPTQKPIGLPALAITETTHEGESVMDFFGGSGSTMMACEQTNRRCYTMELDEHYCDVILARWEKFTGRKAEKIN